MRKVFCVEGQSFSQLKCMCHLCKSDMTKSWWQRVGSRESVREVQDCHSKVLVCLGRGSLAVGLNLLGKPIPCVVRHWQNNFYSALAHVVFRG